MLIVKKSKYFIILLSLPLIFAILFVAAVNATLFFVSSIFIVELQIVLAVSVIANIVLWFMGIARYLTVYSSNYGIFKIMKAEERLPVLRRWDKLFKVFFNQTIWLLIFYFILIGIFVAATIHYRNSIDMIDGLILLLNATLFSFQFYRINKLLGRFINLEMDFTIITNSKIRHTNQLWISFETVTIEMDKIKSINSDKSGRLRSIFDYGAVSIITDGDSWNASGLALSYIRKPETIENLLNKIKGFDTL